MKWLENLKKLLDINIKIDCPITVNIGNKTDVKTKDKSDNKLLSDNSYYHNPDERKLYLILENIESKKKEKLYQILNSAVQEDQPLLETETANMLGRLDNYIQNPGQDRAIKSFFKPIIPASDYDALEASLFLRNEFHQHRDVSKLKEDIRKKFGERGKNIANLCTAGYFENFLTDLYNASPGKFTELYDEIVKVGIFAVFVNQNMEDWEMATQIESKIAACKRYGLQFLDIHGIGKTNVKKVKEFIDKRKTAFKVYDKKIYESENKDIIIVRLLFS